MDGIFVISGRGKERAMQMNPVAMNEEYSDKNSVQPDYFQG
jgi:hypothetical protein